jgi:hypothetical protein
MKLLSLTINGPDGNPITINGVGGIPTGGIASGEFSKILQTGYSLAIVIGIVFCLYVLVMSGRQYMMSGGDKQKMEQVRHRLSYAILGLVIIFLSYFIISVLTNFFGFIIK